MHLGNLLDETQGEPSVGRPVEFRVTKTTNGGKRRHRVKAVLYPVCEADRQQARRDALTYLRTSPGSPYRSQEGQPDPSIPLDVLEEERAYKFLTYALHTPDSSLARLVGADDYDLFRGGVVVEQIVWLKDQYDRLIEQEYPEIVTQKEKEGLIAEARGK